MPKNIHNIPDTDRNILLDPVNSAGLITFDSASPLPWPMIPKVSTVNNQITTAEDHPNEFSLKNNICYSHCS